MFIYYLIIYLFHLSYLYHTSRMCPPFFRIQLFHFLGPFILGFVLLCSPILFCPSFLQGCDQDVMQDSRK